MRTFRPNPLHRLPPLAAAALLAVLAACGRPASEPRPARASAPAEPGARGPAVVRRTIDRVPSLDPAKAQSLDAGRIVGLVYEPLLEYDYLARPYALRGCLAEDLPEVSDDGLTLRFRLRKGVMFGPDRCFGSPDARRELVADDIVYSLKRVADAQVSLGSWWTLKGRVVGLDAFHQASTGPEPTDYDAPVEGLVAEDDHTLVLRLTQPSPQLLWCLAMPTLAAVPREAVEYYGPEEFGQREVGTGPFRLTFWRRNYRMTLERRPGRDMARDATPAADPEAAAGARPVDRIEWVVMDDASTHWLAFVKGELDVEGNIPRDQLESVLLPDGSLAPEIAARGIRMMTQPGIYCTYVGLNMEDPVIGTNKKLRQALNAAFDYEEWARLNPFRTRPSSGPVPPGVGGRLETPFPYAYDLEKARRLLAEAGYPGGTDPATGKRLVLTMGAGRTDQETRETSELLASFYARIGIDLRTEYSNWPSFLEKTQSKRLQMFRMSWIADYPDAENFLQLFYGPNSPSPNRCNFSDPEMDALYEAAANETDEAKRFRLYGKMQEILREECPWIYLCHPSEHLLVHDRLTNVRMHAFPCGMEKHWRVRD